MYLYLEATRDCPLSFDGSEVTRVDFGLPNSRKSDANLNIKVFGDLLEHPSPICARQQVATINCQFYGDRDECESQEAMYVYQSLNKKSSLLLCTLGVAHIVALTINEQIYETNPLMRIEFNDLGTLEEFKEGWGEDVETLLPEILDAYTDTICEYDNVANLDIIIDDNNYFYGDMLTLIKVDVLNSISPEGWTFLDS